MFQFRHPDILLKLSYCYARIDFYGETHSSKTLNLIVQISLVQYQLLSINGVISLW